MSEQEDNLAQEIRADAERRAERRRQAAEREARAILDAARKEAAETARMVLDRSDEWVERLESVGRARLEQRVASLRLRRRREVLERVRAEALEALARLTEAEGYPDVLTELAARAVEAMSGEQFALGLRPRDRERWGRSLPAAVERAVRDRTGRAVRVTLSDDAPDASSGLVVRGAGGGELADQTFEARMERLWPEIESRVAPLVIDAQEGRP